MATVTFRLRNNTTENATIYVYLSIGRGKQFLCATELTINPSQWKSTNKLLTGYPKNISNPEIKNLKTNLSVLDSYLKVKVNQANTNGTVKNSNWLKQEVNNCFNRKTDNEIQEQTDTLETNKLLTQVRSYRNGASTYIQSNGKVGLGKSRIKSLKLLERIVTDYQKETKTTIYLRNIDFELIESFNNWLLNIKNYSLNYGGSVMRDLKATCNYASKKGVEVSSFVPFIKSYKQQKQDKIIQTLSIEELERIEKLVINTERLNNAKKWIVFGCNIGQRGSDLLNITLKNFVTIKGQKYIELRQEKTNKDVLIPITKQCKRILIEGLPYKVSQQKLNVSIKEVCELAEINQEVKGDLFNAKTKRKARGSYPKYNLITLHCFRRSYATNYYIDIPTPIIMEITGHSKESTFLEYINKPIDKTRNANLMLEMIEQNDKNKASKKETQIIEMKTTNK